MKKTLKAFFSFLVEKGELKEHSDKKKAEKSELKIDNDSEEIVLDI